MRTMTGAVGPGMVQVEPQAAVDDVKLDHIGANLGPKGRKLGQKDQKGGPSAAWSHCQAFGPVGISKG